MADFIFKSGLPFNTVSQRSLQALLDARYEQKNIAQYKVPSATYLSTKLLDVAPCSALARWRSASVVYWRLYSCKETMLKERMVCVPVIIEGKHLRRGGVVFRARRPPCSTLTSCDSGRTS